MDLSLVDLHLVLHLRPHQLRIMSWLGHMSLENHQQRHLNFFVKSDWSGDPGSPGGLAPVCLTTSNN